MSKYRITLDGKTYEMEVELLDGKAVPAPVKTAKKPETPQAKASQEKMPADEVPGSGNSVKSPMPGTIIQIFSGVGDTVKAGQAVLILEAMKMENEITAPKDGKIAALFVSQGDAVQGGVALFEID